ncbi:MAG TPA: ATP-binding protein, partial [Rugosimonospora sp.]|nr:ATP-binding protein [Rugosimonospora sp.]
EPLPGPEDRTDPARWRAAGSVGNRPPLAPADGDADIVIDERTVLALRGHPLNAADARVVEAFAAQATIVLRQERLAAQAAALGPLAEADRLRAALLRAVSHDLRTPLASAKAAVTSLRQHDVVFADADRDELLATADESLDRLARLVENLLDMSRLQAGALGVRPQRLSAAEAVSTAVDELGPAGARVAVHVPDDLPEIEADPALVDRILANLLANALRYSPADRPPVVAASGHGGRVEVRVIDHGPGIPAPDWDRIFQPFQRLGDTESGAGTGLGLALSRGLAEAMGGTLEPDHTPGGGLTMTLRLPSVDAPAVPGDGLDTTDADPLDRWRGEMGDQR